LLLLLPGAPFISARAAATRADAGALESPAISRSTRIGSTAARSTLASAAWLACALVGRPRFRFVGRFFVRCVAAGFVRLTIVLSLKMIFWEFPTARAWGANATVSGPYPHRLSGN
jgi:hypothetical protein